MIDSANTCSDQPLIPLFVVPPPKLKTQKQALDGSRKRNIEEIEDESNEEIKKEEPWTEYIIKCKENAIEKKKNVSTNGTEYVWEIIDGIEVLTLK